MYETVTLKSQLYNVTNTHSFSWRSAGRMSFVGGEPALVCYASTTGASTPQFFI